MAHSALMSRSALLALLLGQAAMAEGPITLEIATLSVEGSSAINALRAAADEIRKRSDGRVQVRVLPAGHRGDETTAIKALLNGEIQGAVVSAVGIGKLAPEVLVLQSPGLIPDYKQLDLVRTKLAKRFDEAFLPKELVLLGWGDAGYTYLLSKTPLRTPSDLKGAKPWVATSDDVTASLFRLAGAAPTPLMLGDVLPNLLTGAVQTVYSSPLAAIALQWFKHTKYITNMKLGIGIGATVLAKASWDLVGDADKKMVREVMDACHKSLATRVRTDNAAAVKTLKDRGLEVIQPEDSAWNALYVQVQNDLAGKLYPAELLAEVRKLVAESK